MTKMDSRRKRKVAGVDEESTSGSASSGDQLRGRHVQRVGKILHCDGGQPMWKEGRGRG